MNLRMKFLAALGLGLSANSQAADIFEYQGAYLRAYGGAAVVMGRGGESVLQNPANLWASSRSDIYADLGLLSLSYKITTPDTNTKPGAISLPVLPLPSLGGSFKWGKLAFGAMLLPTGIGSTNKVEDFPIQVGGAYQTVDIEAAQRGFKLGVGAAYRATTNLSLGLSAVYDTFFSDSKIKLTETDAIATRSKAAFIRPIVGLRYRWPKVGILALSYQFPKKYPYSLEIQAFEEPTQSFERTNYRPTVYSLGLHTRRIGSFSFFGQYSYEVWVPATLFAQSPNQAAAGDIDVEFLNTHNYVLGSRYRWSRGNFLSFSYSIYNKNKGPGLLSETGEILLNGRGPQDFEALDRYHLTLAYESNGKRSTQLYYASFIRASALNPEDTPNAGFYELSVYLLGFSYIKL